MVHDVEINHILKTKFACNLPLGFRGGDERTAEERPFCNEVYGVRSSICFMIQEIFQWVHCPISYGRTSKFSGKPETIGSFGSTKLNAIVHLSFLGLFDLSFAKDDELRPVLLLVSNSPNVKKIKLEMSSYDIMDDVSQAAKDYFDLVDCSNIILDHIRELEITNFTGMKPEMDFVKHILAKSPMLEKVRLEFDIMIDFQKRFGTLEGLLKLPRASSRAKIIFG
ncbi:F-box/FBD/LRR-repeat protein At1g13570-like [Bidens hawaiensis]|uniref:F-box/FBD/LRR-repeat protein At1g13570-like n=1 Tax=Bidens hawaiensis TaxID=980011 RepID=UPI00404AD663